ncbi:MAG: DUF4845 domain-containing protein [Rhodanobacteraceae bacterium]
MRASNRFRGITLIGFLILLIVAGFFAYLAMRLVPVYVEYFGVVKALEQVKSEPGSAQKSLYDLRRDLNLKFDTQYVDEADVTPEDITLERESGGATLRIHYERRVPFIYNVDLLATFDKAVLLTNGGS